MANEKLTLDKLKAKIVEEGDKRPPNYHLISAYLMNIFNMAKDDNGDLINDGIPLEVVIDDDETECLGVVYYDRDKGYIHKEITPFFRTEIAGLVDKRLKSITTLKNQFKSYLIDGYYPYKDKKLSHYNGEDTRFKDSQHIICHKTAEIRKLEGKEARENLSIERINITYAEYKNCKKGEWHKFIEYATNSAKDNLNLQILISQIYFLGNPLRACIFIIGKSLTGKGVFLNTLHHCKFSRNFEYDHLNKHFFGAEMDQFNIIGITEIPTNTEILNDATIKRATDPRGTDNKNKSYKNLEGNNGFVFTLNDEQMPSTADLSDASIKRAYILRFNNVPEKIIDNYEKILAENNRVEIFKWLVEGFQSYKKLVKTDGKGDRLELSLEMKEDRGRFAKNRDTAINWILSYLDKFFSNPAYLGRGRYGEIPDKILFKTLYDKLPSNYKKSITISTKNHKTSLIIQTQNYYLVDRIGGNVWVRCQKTIDYAKRTADPTESDIKKLQDNTELDIKKLQDNEQGI